MTAVKPGAITVPEELKRKSEIVENQLINLNRIIDLINERLENMITIMKNYSPELVEQFGILKASLETYKEKANTIYSEISESLGAYANNLLYYLGELTSKVNELKNTISSL